MLTPQPLSTLSIHLILARCRAFMSFLFYTIDVKAQPYALMPLNTVVLFDLIDVFGRPLNFVVSASIIS